MADGTGADGAAADGRDPTPGTDGTPMSRAGAPDPAPAPGAARPGGSSRLIAGLLAELAAESESLDALVAGLEPADWARTTPAPGWTVAHQIAHLNWTDEQALLAVTDEEAFGRAAREARNAPATFVDEGAEQGAGLPPRELLARWRERRAELARALAAVPEGRRVPWYGPPMGAASMATARLMETWAHGEDTADALAVRRAPTDRLRHVVRIGVRARDFSYLAHRLDPPTEPFRVELAAPDGALWTHGPQEADQRVTGDAVDFCRLVTQRLHRDDADVRADGAEAERWLRIAQAFAGPPGAGRPPRDGRDGGAPGDADGGRGQ